MKYIVIAKVNGREYLTNVEAQSALCAEHAILEKGICTAYGYGVDGAMAYDSKTIKTDCFVGQALNAEPISYCDLLNIIEEHNDTIRAKAAVRERIFEIENEMKKLREELEAAKKIVAA